MGLASLIAGTGRRAAPTPAVQGVVGAAVAAVAARAAYALLTRATPDARPVRVPGPRAEPGGRPAAGPSTAPRAARPVAASPVAADLLFGAAAGPGAPAAHGAAGPGSAGARGRAATGAADLLFGPPRGSGAPAPSPEPDPDPDASGPRDAAEPAPAPVADPSRAGAWWRTNFRGRRVTLQEGPALAYGVCAASLLTPGPDPRARAATALAAAGAAGFGAYDDLAGSAGSRGLRGHLGALARGRVTTGAVKMAGIGATGLAAAALLRRGPLDTLVDGALIAAGANLVNLFDLRPGRAVKVGLLAALPGLASPAAPLLAPTVGACAALLPDDLAERSMLGDAGANALGAALCAAAAARAPRRVRLALLGGVVALTLASEVTSFSAVIDRVPPLRALDRWGRCA